MQRNTMRRTCAALLATTSVLTLFQGCRTTGHETPGIENPRLSISMKYPSSGGEDLSASVRLAGTPLDAGGPHWPGETLRIEAVVDNPNHWRFSHWTGAVYGTENPRKITMDHDKKVMAHFVPHAMLAYEDFFARPGLPGPQWDIRPASNFGNHSGMLEAFGHNGPNTLGSTTALQDLDLSVWLSYRDIRPLDEIPDSEQTIDFELRRSEDGSSRVWVRVTPRGISLMSRGRPARERTLGTAVAEFGPGVWSNLRMRVVDNQARVWLRGDAGQWEKPLLAATLPSRFQSAAYAITVHPGASYKLANFRIHPCGWEDIDFGIDAIDKNDLMVAVGPEGSARVRPSGGRYPPGETVYLALRPEPDMVLRKWQDLDEQRSLIPAAEHIRVRMDNSRRLTAELRCKYGAPPPGGGKARYDSGYAPHGVTQVDLTGLVNSYQSEITRERVEFFPARVTIEVKDYPDDDPLRKVVLAGPEDVRDTDGNPILHTWPVGTQMTIKADPLAHSSGFNHILMAWVTEPGSAINQCPTPEYEHSFTMPPVEPDQKLIISLLSGVVDKEVRATVPAGTGKWLDSDIRLSRGTSTARVIADGHEEGTAYRLLGPVGAAQDFTVSYRNRTETVDFAGSLYGPLGMASWNKLDPVSQDGKLHYPPWRAQKLAGPPVREVPLVTHGDRGDLMIVKDGVFVEEAIDILEEHSGGSHLESQF